MSKVSADIPAGIEKSNWKPHPHEIVRNKDLSAQAYRVWAVIRSHEGRDGQTELGNDRICTESNLNIRTVQRAKKELVSQGLLAVLRQPRNQHSGACQFMTKVPRQKRASKDTHYQTSFSGSIPSPAWEKRMILKHSCHGCGWCHECRTNEERRRP